MNNTVPDFNRRVIAALLDFIPIIILTLVVTYLLLSNPEFIKYIDERVTVYAEIGFVTTIVFYVISSLYNILSLGIFGTTLGKKITKIKLISSSNSKAALGQIIIREALAKQISGFFFNIGYLYALADPEGRAFHDILCHTKIIYTQSSASNSKLSSNKLLATALMVSITIALSIANILLLPGGVMGRELFIFEYVARPYKLVNSAMAMMPTYNPGEYIFVDLISQEVASFKRADIVMFEYHDMPIIGRIIGLSNEEIEIRSGEIYISGKSLPEPYINGQKTQSGSYLREEVPRGIPEDYYVILGDNRQNSSYDNIGLVHRSQIIGKVLLCYRDCK